MAKVRSHVDEKELFAGMGGSNLLAGKPKEDNLRILFLGASHIKDKVIGATMPAFDEQLDTCDEAYPTSVVPCWTSTPDAPRNPRDFVPSPWAVPLMFYTFVGPENRHFFAPQNRAKMLRSYDAPPDPSDLRDPFNDVRMHLKRGDKKTFEYYTKGGATTSPLLPSRGVKYLSFAKVRDRNDKNAKVVVVARTATCRDFEITQMRWLAEGNPRQSRYPRYLLGDVTDPNSALEWYVDKFLVDPKDVQETNVIRWTEEMQVLPPNATTVKFSDDDLRLRFTFVDDNCWYIPTYQEMLDVLVNELTDIPLETIKEACGRYGNVGERDGERTTRRQPNSRQQPDDDGEETGVLKSLGRASTLPSGAPPMPEGEADIPFDEDDIPFDGPSAVADSGDHGPGDDVPPPPVEDVPPPPADEPPPPPEETFWACKPGDKPYKAPRSEIVAAVASVPNLKVRVGDAWLPAGEALGGQAPTPTPAAQGPVTAEPPDQEEVKHVVSTILMPTGKKLEQHTAGQQKFILKLAAEVVRSRRAGGKMDASVMNRLTAIAAGGEVPEG